jgi:hypothetical protein
MVFSTCPVACNTLFWSLAKLIFIGYCSVGAHAGKYIDWHRNYGVGGLYETLFHPTNDVDIKRLLVSTNSSLQGLDKLSKSPKIQDVEFMSGLQALKDIVDKAATNGRRLRPCKLKVIHMFLFSAKVALIFLRAH